METDSKPIPLNKASQDLVRDNQTRLALGRRLIAYALGQKEAEERLEEVRRTGQQRTA